MHICILLPDFHVDFNYSLKTQRLEYFMLASWIGFSFSSQEDLASFQFYHHPSHFYTRDNSKVGGIFVRLWGKAGGGKRVLTDLATKM